MRKYRNPRYAPEGLERKLSPSSLVVVAAVSGIDSPPTYPPTTPYPPTGNGSPPIPTPTEPGGPLEPTAFCFA